MMRTTYTRDLSQWMYHKRRPFPGAWLAPLQLPGIRGMWGNKSAANDAADFTRFNTTFSNSLNALGVMLSSNWPGISYIYAYTSNCDAWVDLSDQTHLAITTAQTIGGWFYLLAPNTAQALMIWHNVDEVFPENNAPVYLWLTGGAAQFGIYKIPTEYEATSGPVAANAWHFIVGRFTPSTEVAIFLDSIKASNTSGIPASCNDSAGPYMELDVLQAAVAYGDTATYLAQCWVCAYAVPDAMLNWLYAIQAPLYGR